MGGSSNPQGAVSLLGRDSECAQLDEFIAAVREGHSRALVLRGEAGIGKTALLRYLLASAKEMTVVRAAGVESEMELAFATLHQLCAPWLDRLERLPDPQRDALEVVFGKRLGSAPDRFVVGLAVLSLLSEAANERPLLCVVDDAQWVDQESALTLAFVARRLQVEPVGVIFAARDPGEALRSLTELEVGGLRQTEARTLLDLAVPSVLDPRVRDRIIAETRGNPLALLELPRGLSATELAGGFAVPESHPLAGRIEESYLRRAERLSEDAQRLLLVAAAEPLGDPLISLRACERLGVSASEVDTDGLLDIQDRVTFHHPLARSAVYRSAKEPLRRAAHLALAEVTDRETDPDRCAWHRAAAAAGPDEEVALELELSAGRAKARGGFAAAAAFLRRAVALTGDLSRRTERALAAAQASLEAGAIESAHALLARAEAGPLDELERARLDLLRAQAAYAESRGSEAPALLLRAAKALEPHDLRLARETYLDAWSAALFAGQLASASLLEISHEALAARRPAAPLRPSDLLLDGFSLVFTDGREAGAPVLAQAATGFAGDEASIDEVLRWSWLAAAGAVMAWDLDTCLAVATRGVQAARESGALTVLAVSLNVMAQAVALGGDLTQVASLVDDANVVTEATATQVAPYGALVMAGLKGREADASPLIEGTIKQATAGGQGTAVQYGHWANSLLLNGLGRYPEALRAAKQASDDTQELFVSAWAASEVIEAAVRSGEIELARESFERLAIATDVAPTGWARGIKARARAQLEEGDGAEALYREAVERLGRTRLRPDTARAHLLYGEWLRREGRRVDARAQLRTAHELFEAIGMEAFAERTRGELMATGERVRKRTVETRDELTAQEQQIARLAREGLSNSEIAARLFLSSRTVEWHLGKIFSKLDIRSRRELMTALADPDPETLQPR